MAAAEVVGREPVEHVRGAARRKHVTRTRDEIAGGLGRPRSCEHSARAPHALHHLCGVLRHNLEVLGRKAVHDLQPLGDALRDDDEDPVSVNDALDERLSRKRLGLAKDLGSNFLRKLLGGTDAKRLFPAAAVLGLRKKVCRDPADIYGTVG